MRYALFLTATVAWGLWFGATIAMFVLGVYFHRNLPPATFADAADAMFAAFSKYQLALGGAALFASGMAWVTYPSRWTLGLLAGFLGAFLMAVIFGLGFLPLMQGLRHQGMSGSPQYRQMHGKSMVTLTVEAAILLGTGAVLAATPGRRLRAPVTEPADLAVA